jgi:hypothetical protein
MKGFMRISLRVFICALSFGFLVSSTRAAEVQWPAQFGKWATAMSKHDAPAVALMRDNPILKESGLVSVSSRSYGVGTHVANLELYTFHDSSGAYEAYTYLQDAESEVKMFHTAICRSNQVVDIWSESELEGQELAAMAEWLGSISDGVPSPPVVSFLPTADRVHRSDRYALGPAAFYPDGSKETAAAMTEQVGFNSGAETVSAKFKSARGEATLLLIDYPTPQLAEQHIHHLQTAIATIPKLADTKIERKGSLLSLVLEPTSEAYAAELRNAVNYGTAITWNEPHQTATEPPFISMVAKIFIFTGFFMVVAVVLGIAFGGVRIITKRFFPGKVFDRPEQMEVLQLGLSGKRIDPRDLY